MTRTVLSANDAFWLSPLMDMSVNDTTDDNDDCATAADAANDSDSSTTTNSCSSLNDDMGSSSSSSLPPAHYQLLSTEQVPTYSELKGYDHSIQESVVCYSSDCEEEEQCYRGGSISSVKQQGSGSWLLGTFARLNHTQQAIVDDIDKSINDEHQERQDAIPPGLVRVASGSSLESDDTESLNSSISSSTTSTKKRRSGVSFSTSVKIQPIPHSSSLSPSQRRNMYSSSYEVRLNKVRNKKEYKYDGYDWRSVTEEWEMGVDMISGELVHPVHEQLA